MIKKSKTIFCIILGFYFLSFLVILKPAFAKVEGLDFIPKDSDAVIFINNDPEDPGFSFATGLWKERFEIKEDPKKYEAIDQLYSELPFGKIAGAVFLPEEAYTQKKEPIYPEYIVVIETTGRENIFKQTIEILIKKKKPLKEIKYLGYKIIYRDKVLEPYHGQKDLAAYVQIKNFFVIATTPEQLKLALDTYKGKLDSISKNEEFLKLTAELSEGDAFIFVNNKTERFSDNLRRWEEKEGMRLLLSSELIDSLALSIDLETNDAVKGKIIFLPKSGENIINIEDDAYFFAEIVTRSFAREDIDWISSVETSSNLVKVEFEGTGFIPIWEEALLNKRISFLEKKQAPLEIEEEVLVKSSNNLVKSIFVITITFIILLVVLFLRRTKK